MSEVQITGMESNPTPQSVVTNVNEEAPLSNQRFSSCLRSSVGAFASVLLMSVSRMGLPIKTETSIMRPYIPGRSDELTSSSLAFFTEQHTLEPLTEREKEILGLIGAGLSNQDIARQMVIVVSTVKWHIRHIYACG